MAFFNALRDVPITRKSEFTIRGVEPHFRSPGHYDAAWTEFRRTQEADKNSVWVSCGDLTDDDRPSTRERRKAMFADRTEAYTQEDKDYIKGLRQQMDIKIGRIADSCAGMVAGDHYRLFANGTNSVELICKWYGIPYLGERMGPVRLTFFRADEKKKGQRLSASGASLQYNMIVRHGRGGGTTNGADVNALERQNKEFDADLFMGGHTHKANAHPRAILRPNQAFNGWKERTIWYVRVGALLRGFMPGKELYPEKKEYGPLLVGWGECTLTIGRPVAANRNLEIMKSVGKTVVL